MKASAYNYTFYKDDKSFWFNGITKKFFRISRELGIKTEKILAAGKFDALPDNILDKFISNGFLIPKDCNELDMIRSYNQEVINKKDYFLVILPTLNCNFNCWYCIQHHIPSVMSEQTKQLIMKHIKYMIEFEKIKSLHIEWFGGEPFMGYKNIILPLSNFAKDLCEKHNIPFYNTATTNGFFISEEKYGSMSDILMNGFQITLDGERERHNSVKQSGSTISAFDTTLKNISGYLKFNKEATLKLRINYTHDNLTPQIVEQVETFFPKDMRKRVQINLKKVWQEKVDKNYYEKTLNIQKYFSNKDFNVNKLDIVTGFVPCYANRKYYTAVNFNGNLLKCTASDDLYSKNPLGHINPDGSLSWKDGVESGYMAHSFENKKCLECKYLPICMGQCPRNYLRNRKGCKMDAFDIKLDEGIINYINESYDASHN